MSTREYTTFQLNDQQYAIDILCVREINRMLDITPVQKAPEYIRGLSNLRGQVITVFDLSNKLGSRCTDIGENTYNIVLKTNEELAPIRDRERRPDLITSNKDIVSLLVGQIGDVITVDKDDISPPPANRSSMDDEFLSGVISHNNTLINLINVGKVLEVSQANAE